MDERRPALNTNMAGNLLTLVTRNAMLSLLWDTDTCVAGGLIGFGRLDVVDKDH